ncbi:hypothetical protein N657DRAFT_647635 [Parathielavia appendiculata]|uniref:Secreted protein n=1 Tax=Parathielavia appendiculata TaxID=2587402 RepID=A0AAN6TVM2_9PEZI|nr:hypothetical protein N657DRAFT_647635 [Parathielavia appendiculata]
MRELTARCVLGLVVGQLGGVQVAFDCAGEVSKNKKERKKRVLGVLALVAGEALSCWEGSRGCKHVDVDKDSPPAESGLAPVHEGPAWSRNAATPSTSERRGDSRL